jgi:hypothetical protein
MRTGYNRYFRIAGPPVKLVVSHLRSTGKQPVHTPSQEIVTPSPASPPSNIPRVWAALLALLLGYYFVLGPARELWLNYWLIRDGEQGVAVITKAHWAGHGVFIYRYRLNQKTYTGQDHRSYQNPKYANVMPGEETVVYFSSSHPSLSAINMPQGVMFGGLPVVLLAWVFVFLLAATAINPKSRWALRNRQQPVATNGTGDSQDPHSRVPAAEVSAPPPQPDDFVIDKLKVVAWALLLVLAMAAIVTGVDVLFGRK